MRHPRRGVFGRRARSYGEAFAFEVGSIFISRRRLCKILGRIAGVRILRSPLPLSGFREEEFCEFELNGELFAAWEPYGDNSRFWIGPASGTPSKSIQVLIDAFRNHRVNPLW